MSSTSSSLQTDIFTDRYSRVLRTYRRDLYDEVDVSHEAQLRSVESSFEAANVDDSLSSFRHPTKPSVHAVESYEVLPDADTWANAYDLFKFSERPGDRNPEVRGKPPPYTNH